MVTEAQLAGYVLEELLASLLQESGYELLSSREDDPDTLEAEGHGLLVRGRGCSHQVDALGTLTTPVPFGLPLRLFVEAKHRVREVVGIEVVRNAYGVLADVNQFCPAGTSRRRVAYQYSLVSTRGFSPRAVAYALTHGIALHDFSGDAWKPVRDTVDAAVKALKPLVKGSTTATPVPLSSLRVLLRAALNTLERSVGDPSDRPDVDDASTRRRVREATRRPEVRGTLSRGQVSALLPQLVELARRHDRSLLVGYPDGELMLALRPDRTADLDEYLTEHARVHGAAAVIPVQLVFSPVRPSSGSPAAGSAGDWVIEPVDRPGAFRLRVGLPEGFERHLLTTEGPAARPGDRSACITVYRAGIAHRLQYELLVREGEDDGAPSLRTQRKNNRVAITPAALAQEPRRMSRADAHDGERQAAPPAPRRARPAPTEQPDVPNPSADEPQAEPIEQLVDDTRWGDDEVEALLTRLEEQTTAPAGRRRSAKRNDERRRAEQALALLHALAVARGELGREEVCARLDRDPTARFTRRASAVTAATKVLKRRGDVAATRGTVLHSARKGRRTGSNGVTTVTVRPEFVEPLQRSARRAAERSVARPAPQKAAASGARPAVPRQRSRGVLTP